MVRILPFIEEEGIYGAIDQNGSVTGRLLPDSLPWNKHNRDLLRSERFPWMFCPSSSLDQLVLTT